MENKLVIIDGERLQELIDSINSLREAVLSAPQNPAPVQKQLPIVNPNPFDWIPLEQFLEVMRFNKRHYERYYKTKIKRKVFKHKTFIHKPSFEKWFMDTSI